jgi:succinate dehydrogenase/fumarate reductase flavoprotein subunit
MPSERVIETDVLVIGGGMAGIFAAIKASEQGLTVTLLDKGYVGKSGQSPFAMGFIVFNPDWGDDLAAWMSLVTNKGEYINNRDWMEITLKESYARYQDLVSWGIEFRKNKDGTLLRSEMHSPCKCAMLADQKKIGDMLRKQVIKRGVKIIDRFMVTDLLKQDGRIVGIIGFSVGSYDIGVFKAGATVLCTGAGGFKAWGFPIAGLTSDGHVMAYRAGAVITGKEFADTHFTYAANPAQYEFSKHVAPSRSGGMGRWVNAEGDEILHDRLFLYLQFEAHAGRAPIYEEYPDGRRLEKIAGAASGLAVHKTEGIWPAGLDCSTDLPGLYAAGDALGNYQNGATYGTAGSALCGSAATGTIAGTAAAEYAKKAGKPAINQKEITRLKEMIMEPTERKGGFSPRWVTQLLQNTMMPYFVSYVKKEDRLKAALTNVEFYRDHLVPLLFARDPHELRLAIETKNMVLNAEMILKASLFRQESRGCHYREDYPHRDDPKWLAWVLQKEENGDMKMAKKPIPKKWWPDLTKPYLERYRGFARFPEE